VKKATNGGEESPARSASFNGLPISRAAHIDRESYRAESNFQKRADLEAAKRRRLDGLVSRHAGVRLSNTIYCTFTVIETVKKQGYDSLAVLASNNLHSRNHTPRYDRYHHRR
jgi:hypothetical protein